MINHDSQRTHGAADGAGSPEARRGFSLNEAAAHLLQLGTDDRTEITQLRISLEDLAFEGGLPIPVQARVAGAARRLADALGAEGEEAAEEALRQAGELIGLAMEDLDGIPSSASTAAPVQTELPGRSRADRFLVDDSDLSLLSDFITESREYMESAEASLLELETNPDDIESINTVFRAFHTIKGTSAFLGLEPISELAHHAESLFDRFRDGELRCTGARADVSLRSVDMLQALLERTENAAGSGEPLELPPGYGELLGTLEDPETGGLLETVVSEPVLAVTDTAAHPAPLSTEGAPTPADARKPPLKVIDSLPSPAAATPPAAPTPAPANSASRSTAPDANESVRVRTDRLDQLIDMVGELVIAHSMVAQDDAILARENAGDLTRKVAHAGKIVRELQDLSVALRMVPLRATFQRMNRLVRDVARKSGKAVDFRTAGEETEVDRNMVDLISDPLVHMIRNAIDHGIESPEERAARGKERAGTVSLSAYHAGGNVVVELSDDGRGLDREAIVRKAVANGIIAPEQNLTDQNVYDLIFAPGFSTAESVTDLSGRGVGMDVVRRSIESLSGRIEIDSAAGRGSTFTIRLPLTLAVTDGMLVTVGGERFILPITNIQMTFRPSPGMLSTVAGKAEMVLLREDLLRVVRLHQIFGIEGAVHDPTSALLVIVGFGQQRCALLVDELLEQQQVVAKPLGEGLGKVPGISGGAILGDGRVGLILDISEIVSLANNTPLRPAAAVRERAS